MHQSESTDDRAPFSAEPLSGAETIVMREDELKPLIDKSRPPPPLPRSEQPTQPLPRPPRKPYG